MLHNVYFWLKPELTAEQRSTFESEALALLQIDYIVHGFVGRPAPTEQRPVTDHTFTYSLTLHFKNMADHDYYQKDCPKHKRFVDACKEMWTRVVVYDSSPVH